MGFSFTMSTESKTSFLWNYFFPNISPRKNVPFKSLLSCLTFKHVSHSVVNQTMPVTNPTMHLLFIERKFLQHKSTQTCSCFPPIDQDIFEKVHQLEWLKRNPVFFNWLIIPWSDNHLTDDCHTSLIKIYICLPRANRNSKNIH